MFDPSLKGGAEVNAADSNGWSVLHHAALNIDFYEEILKYLVSEGADVHDKTETGLTPLHLAAMDNPRREVLECLIRLGADVHRENDIGKTALDVASEDKKKEILRKAMGIAKPEMPSRTGKSYFFPGDSQDLYESVQRMQSGDILTILPGIYRFSTPLQIDKEIQIRGSTGNPEDVTLESSGEGCLVITAENARIQDLTLKDTGGIDKSKHAAVDISYGQSTLHHCRITSAKGRGVSVSGDSAHPVLTSCCILNNARSGIFIQEDGKGSFSNCEVSNNKFSGITIETNGNPTLTGCRFYGSKNGRGICVQDGGKGSFDNCEVHNNALAGIEVTGNSDPIVTGCKFHSNKDGAGIFVKDSGRGTFEHCESYNNAYAGIEVSEKGDPTVIGCKFYDNTKGRGVLIHEGGKGTFNNCEAYNNEFAGIEVKTKGDPTVTECKFYDGKTMGIFVYYEGKGTFDNCEVYNNVDAGLSVMTKGDPTVTGCKFYEGQSEGICITSGGKGTYERNILSGNAKNWGLYNPGTLHRVGNSPNE